jgi:methylmalonyl-CoA mutase N-terminal domain/subunit
VVRGGHDRRVGTPGRGDLRPSRQSGSRVDPGRVLAGIEQGWFQSEIADAAYTLERKLASGRRILVGANAFCEGDNDRPVILSVGEEVEELQLKRLDGVKRRRSAESVSGGLAAVRQSASEPDVNLMPALLQAVRAYATVGEIMGTLAGVFGRWTETPSI